MTDITEKVAPNTRFAEAMREAEAKAAAEQLGEEPTPVVEEQAVVEAVTPEVELEQTAAETLLAGKYKTTEALEAAHLELQAILDRQGSELGDQRALTQAYEERLAALEQRATTPTPRQITPDLIEQNPAAAAQLAYEQGDTVTLGAAYQQWALEDPAAAATWVGERRADERETRLRAEFDERAKKLEDRFAPIQQQQEQTALANGVAALPPEVVAFAKDAPVVQALANEFPLAAQAITEGTPAQKLEALNMLYGIHRGRTADTLTKATQDVARTTAQEAQAARDEAHVASSTASEAETLTWEQQEQQKATEAFTRGRSLWADALVRPAKK